MTDISPEIRTLARNGHIRFTKHALERMGQRNITVVQVRAMLRNCRMNSKGSDQDTYRVYGRAPAETTGTVDIAAQVKLTEHNGKKVLVITVMGD